ncbi:hypothetical protein D3C76_1334810 [compost metagenome]
MEHVADLEQSKIIELTITIILFNINQPRQQAATKHTAFFTHWHGQFNLAFTFAEVQEQITISFSDEGISHCLLQTTMNQ